jgi:hypothetical protein
MPQTTPPENLKQVDAHFLKNIKPGDRLFHYPPAGDAQTSFAESASAKYTLYSVIGLPTEDDVTLLGSFDEKENPENFSRPGLLNGEWWYNGGLASSGK